MKLSTIAVLLLIGLFTFGLVSAQLPSGDPPPFIEADIEIEAEVDLPGAGGSVSGTIKINTDGLNDVLDAVIGALCRIFPCGGSEEQTRAVLGTSEFEIGDARTGIVIGSGAVGIGEFFAGISIEESTYEWGFFTRFAKDAPVKIRSITFNNDAILTEDYKKALGIEGAYFVPAGKYFVLDNKLTVEVRQQR